MDISDYDSEVNKVKLFATVHIEHYLLRLDWVLGLTNLKKVLQCTLYKEAIS